MPTDHDETLHERYQCEAMIDERIAEDVRQAALEHAAQLEQKYGVAWPVRYVEETK